jgi:hypothetical protein
VSTANPTERDPAFCELLDRLKPRWAILAAACRRVGIDPEKVLKAIRVAAGAEPMPPASVLAPWDDPDAESAGR